MASRGAALRCALLWVATVASSLLGTLSDQRGHDPEYQLDVTLRGSVLLSASIPSDQLVSAAEWDFAPRAGQRVLLVEIRGEGIVQQFHSQDRFGSRMEVINKTCLRIRDLETGDDGIFKARVKFHGGSVKDYSFILTLHEPVPHPRVSCSVTSRFPEGCNVTLYCEGAGNGEFDISWAKGEPPQVLEEGRSDWYRLSGNGTALQLPWRFGSSPSPLTCLVSNAAETKRASLGVASCCHPAGAKGTRTLLWPWYLLAIMVTTAVLLGSLWVWTEGRKRTPHRDPPKTEQPCEAKYSELRPKARSPGSGCSQPSGPPSELRLKSQTIYAVLESESHLYNEVS